jgi:hypothetical protein
MIVDTRCGNIRTPKAANRFAKKDPLSGGVSLLLSEQAQHAALAKADRPLGRSAAPSGTLGGAWRNACGR